MDDDYLCSLAEERLKSTDSSEISFEDELVNSNTSIKDLDNIPMEYGEDFE